MTPVEEYALRLGDDALILSQRLAEWCTHSPELEEDVALANIALDLLGQARTLLTYAGGSGGSTEDDLAYLRSDHEFRNAQLVELPGGDFAHTIARQLIFSTYQHGLYEALQSSRDATLAGLAAKAVKEVTYHQDHAMQWTLRLGDGTDESHRRMQAGLEAMWPYAAELFESDPLVSSLSSSGVAVDPSTLEPAWRQSVSAVLAEATLAVPETQWHPTGGRRGVHTEALSYLLAEMQVIARAHPGATW